jgi:hypothetical protein
MEWSHNRIMLHGGGNNPVTRFESTKKAHIYGFGSIRSKSDSRRIRDAKKPSHQFPTFHHHPACFEGHMMPSPAWISRILA